MDEPREMLGLPAFGFAGPGDLRDQLTEAVLSGIKTGTSSLAVEYATDEEPLPAIGQRFVIYDSAQRPVGIIETTGWKLSTLALVDDDFAFAEGEGYRNAAEWRVSHEEFWTDYLDDLRRDLGDPDFALTDSTVVVCEWFRLVARVDPTTGAITDEPRRPASAPNG